MGRRIAERMGRMESSGIRRVFDLAANLQDPVNLSIGQPDFDTPQAVKEAGISAIREGRNKYTQTQGIAPLREAVISKLAKQNGIHAEDVLITSGVMGGFYLGCCVLINPGDEIIMPDPYFVAYKHIVRIMGGTPVYVDTYPDFHPKPADIKKAVSDRTKMILLNSPNNPTGHVYPEKVIKEIVDIAAERDIMILSDEIYEPYVYSGKHVSPGSMYENVLTLNGFSKTCSVTGWRIGYASGPRDVIEEMKKLQQYSFVCAPSFAQHAMVSSMDVDISSHVQRYDARRKLLYRELHKLFPMERPEGAFYLFPMAPIPGSAFVEKAIENNLLIIPGNVFSERDTHFRLSYAAKDEHIEKAIEILKRLHDELS